MRKVSKTKRKPLKPLNLPEVPAEKLTPEGLVAMLDAGIPIWTWTSLLDKCNIVVALKNQVGNALDGFAVYRKEYDLLVKYIVIIDDSEVYLKISEICMFTIANVMHSCHGEILNAYKVYYDDADMTAHTQYYVHDLQYSDVINYLVDNRTMIIGDEHFFTKP